MPITLSWVKRQVTNLFILSIITLFTIDVLPFDSLDPTRSLIDPFMDLGLWQGPYYLFCPDVDKENIRLTAKIIGVQNQGHNNTSAVHQTWFSPNWTEMGSLQKKRLFRQMQYYDNVRRDQYQPLWIPLAEYLIRTINPNATKVLLFRHWTDVNPPPQRMEGPVVLDYEPEGTYRFYTYLRP